MEAETMTTRRIQRKDGVVQRYHVKAPTGNCYEAHGHAIIEKFGHSKGAVLVHGEVWHPQTGWHGHAWIELNGAVIDLTNGRNVAIDKKRYYTLGKVRKTKRYTPHEAAEKMLQTSTYGPWRGQ
jgi:hypothetical protein